MAYDRRYQTLGGSTPGGSGPSTASPYRWRIGPYREPAAGPSPVQMRYAYVGVPHKPPRPQKPCCPPPDVGGGITDPTNPTEGVCLGGEGVVPISPNPPPYEEWC